MAAESLSRLLAEERDEPLFVWTDSTQGTLSVEVSDGASTWQGTLCTEQLEKFAELSKMSLESFQDQTKSALSGKRTDEESSFVYSATCGKAGELQFVWKKLSGGIKFHLGNITLTPVQNKTVNSHLLNHCLDCVNVLEQKIALLTEKCDRFKDERQIALERLNTCTLAQETLETEIYGKFKLILNEKKAKIRKLIESKSYLSEQNEEMQRQIWELKSHAAPVAEQQPEEQQEPSNQVKRKKPSTSTTTDLESLLCDAPLKAPSPPPSKRRQINRGARKGKAEIPQPPSLHLHSSTEHSSNENNIEMSLESSDLLDML